MHTRSIVHCSILILLASFVKSHNHCQKDQTWYKCKPTHNSTCSNYKKADVATSNPPCEKGCFCKVGLLYDEENDRCVCSKDCPKKCGPDEKIYEGCAPKCYNTCKNYGKEDVICTKDCYQGCFCKEHLVLRETDGKCVDPKDCPEQCPENEKYSDTAYVCKYCDPFRPCNKTSSDESDENRETPQPGCECIDDYYRNDCDVCVPCGECPPVNCPENEEVLNSGPLCENCGIRCLAIIHTRKCYCKNGYSRNKDNDCIPNEDCPKDCPANEIYVNCSNPCYTCNHPDPCPTFACSPGCNCTEGYLRNGTNGPCIPAEDCSSAPLCPPNEKYVECANPCMTCDHPEPCPTFACTSGCNCVDGYLRNESGGTCIPKNECPNCPANEIYVNCSNPCYTCEHPDPCPTFACTPGCNCTEGYLRNGTNGPCIPAEKCPPNQNCPANEIYVNCSNPCYTCEHPDPCPTFACTPGCNCTEGYLRNGTNGPCIPVDECPVCPPNEKYVECANPCMTCDHPEPCPTFACTSGCNCVDGYLRNESGGTCIPKNECPISECPPNEKYVDCANPCMTCDYPEPCPTKRCVAGCNCVDGYLRNESGGVCIPKEKCPTPCGENEVFTNCVIDCNTCEERGNCYIEECREGCDCKEGYYRDSNDKCVAECNCPEQKCPKHEVHMDCGRKDENCGSKSLVFKHESKCYCVPGFSRNKRGKCIADKFCRRPHECPENEVYKDHGVKNEYCGANCKEVTNKKTCYCKEGYLRNYDGECVREEDCPAQCPENEQYYPCLHLCNNTCKNYDSSEECTLPCYSGCDCKEGLVRNKYWECVEPINCRNDNCGPDEIYYDECIPCGGYTCNNYGKNDSECTDACITGCSCKPDFVMGHEGYCINPKDCPIVKCEENEEYRDHGLKDENCDSNSTEIIYKKKCYCQDDYLRDSNGKCIPKDKCPPRQCGKYEEYRDHGLKDEYCGSDCKEMTDEKKCYCKDGYLRNSEEQCIRKEKCPPGEECEENEVYKDHGLKDENCGSNSTEQTHEEKCYCKDGYLRDSNGKCVSKNKCPSVHNCPENEIYKKRGLKNEYCRCKCRRMMNKKKCYCKEGYLRNSDGKCISKKDCYSTIHCPKNEVYKKCGLKNEYCGSNSTKIMKKWKCYCKKGYLRNSDGKCISKENCPSDDRSSNGGNNDSSTTGSSPSSSSS